MSNAPLIGVLGKKGSGKDTFGQRLVDRWGFTRLAFADPVKGLALAVNPRIDGYPLSTYVQSLGWDVAKNTYPEIRELIQNIGVGVRDYVGPHAWVQALARKHERVNGPVVVTDVRFINEAKWICDQGGVLIRILRPGLADNDSHVSENEVNNVQVAAEIRNDGDIAELQDRADFLAQVCGVWTDEILVPV